MEKLFLVLAFLMTIFVIGFSFFAQIQKQMRCLFSNRQRKLVLFESIMHHCSTDSVAKCLQLQAFIAKKFPLTKSLLFELETVAL